MTKSTFWPVTGSSECQSCSRILRHLNQRLSKHYRLKGQTGRLIHRTHQRHGKAGEDACISVINWLWDAWAGTAGERYLRPGTIFSKKNFDLRWESVQAGDKPPRWE